MSEFDNFFNEDPWSGIEGPIYPLGRQLYVRDQRFWVSINSDGEYIFFIHEEESHELNKSKDLGDLKVEAQSSNEGTRLIYTLTDASLKDKFSTIIKSVAFNTSPYHGKKLFEEVSKEIISWADFLRPTRKGLTRSELIGLWGEMYFLLDVLPSKFSLYDSVRFWIGPEGKKQDFTLNNMALETKTTLSGDGDAIKISSLEQLTKITDYLYLIHIFLNLSDEETGNSLRKIYEKIVLEIGDDTRLKNLFEVKMSSLYGKATEDQLDEKFDFLKYDIYEVDENFPKLTHHNTPSGITKLKYTINTASIAQFKIDNEIEDVLDE